MPKGGIRPGGGRPKRAAGRSVAQAAPLPAPATLTDAQRRIWEQWAPLASRMGTLVPETAPAFEQLVVVADEVAQLRAELVAAGWRHEGGLIHPFSATYRGLLVRVEVLQQRFGLAPVGRAVALPEAEEADELSRWQGILAPTPRVLRMGAR